jgi:exopolysaccharide biosynthesis protein
LKIYIPVSKRYLRLHDLYGTDAGRKPAGPDKPAALIKHAENPPDESFIAGPSNNNDMRHRRNRSARARHVKNRRGLPVFWIVVIDVLAACAALFIFSLYYFILPIDQSGGARELPTPSLYAGNVSPEPSGQAAGESKTAVRTPAKTKSAQPSPSASADHSTWGAKFAGKFTAGNVEKTENSYKSGNINVQVNKVEKSGVTYYVADIYVKDLKFFRTAFAGGKFGRGMHDATDAIAREKDAVIAINGDYCGYNAGPVVRNGKLYRNELYKDALVLNYDGSMQTFSARDFDMKAVTEKGVWQVWTFGPMLLQDGKPMQEFDSSLNPANPRTAVGYYEPGHYCFVTVDGRQPGYSTGYTLKELSKLFYGLGCKAAFNLDGGQSSEMAFMGSLVNRPYDGGRGTSDIVYIADS